MNPVIATITLRAMLGRARSLLLLLLPLTLILLAVGMRLFNFDEPDVTAMVLRTYALGVVLPLVTLIVGTGVLGAEIDDGTVIYLLAKPVPRSVITLTKLIVAIGLSALFAAVPTLIAGLVLTGFAGGLAVGMGAGALAASAAYCAIFVVLSVSLRHAVAVGLIYILVWESLIATAVDGAAVLSVQAWALTIGDAIATGPQLPSHLGVAVAVVLVTAVLSAGFAVTTRRLGSMTLTSGD